MLVLSPTAPAEVRTFAVPAVTVPAAEDPIVAPVPTATATALASATAQTASTGTAQPTDGETDIALLKRAQMALGSSPGRALALSHEHAARFPRSAMSQEREMIAINALLAMGRAADARARARRFIVRYPKSAHRQRLKAMLSSKKK